MCRVHVWLLATSKVARNESVTVAWSAGSRTGARAPAQSHTHTHFRTRQSYILSICYCRKHTYIIHRDIYVCTGYIYILGIYTHWGRDGPQHKSRITRTYVWTHLLGPTYLLVYVLVCQATGTTHTERRAAPDTTPQRADYGEPESHWPMPIWGMPQRRNVFIIFIFC